MQNEKHLPSLEISKEVPFVIRQKMQNEKHLPSLEISKEVPFVTFFRTDSKLLEVRNQKERGYTWSLVAITSHILALSLALLHDLMNVSLFLVRCKFLLDSPKYPMYIIHF
jgi:hypothetical protein